MLAHLRSISNNLKIITFQKKKKQKKNQQKKTKNNKTKQNSGRQKAEQKIKVFKILY